MLEEDLQSELKEKKHSKENLEGLLSEDKKKISLMLEEETKDLNETERELARQLSITATVLISFSAIFFASNGIANKLTILQRQLIIISWIALIFSIAFGIWQIINDLHFFSNGVKVKQTALEDIANNLIKNERDRDNLYERFKKEIPLFSKNIHRYCQIILLSAGTLSLLLAFSIQIFK